MLHHSPWTTGERIVQYLCEGFKTVLPDGQKSSGANFNRRATSAAATRYKNIIARYGLNKNLKEGPGMILPPINWGLV